MEINMVKKLIFAAVMLLTSSARAQDTALPPLVHPGSTVLLIGDSLAVGLAPEFRNLARSAGYRPVTHTIGGTTASQWIPWLKSDLSTHHPALVVISLGTNDAGANIEWVRNHNTVYARLAKEAMDVGAKVAWIGPPKLSERRLPHAGEIRDMIRDSINAPYYESQDLDFPQAEDKIHSSPKGYKIWMDAVWEWMSMKNLVTPSK